MTDWVKRPVEVANLLNPAFCSVIIFESAKAFEAELQSLLPYSLSFLVLPIILHEGTRNRLPRGTRTRMHSWLQNNPDIRIGFSARTKQMIPFTKEGLLFGMNMDIFRLDQETGSINTIQSRLRRPRWQSGTEANACVRRAAMLGKWFALSGDSTTIYAMWGIQP